MLAFLVRMFKWILISIVVAPVVMGIHAATGRRGPRGLPVLLVVFLGYCVFYLATLAFLRYRWGIL